MTPKVFYERSSRDLTRYWEIHLSCKLSAWAATDCIECLKFPSRNTGQTWHFSNGPSTFSPPVSCGAWGTCTGSARLSRSWTSSFLEKTGALNHGLLIQICSGYKEPLLLWRPSLLDMERNASVAFTFGHPLLLDGWRPSVPNFVELGERNTCMIREF